MFSIKSAILGKCAKYVVLFFYLSTVESQMLVITIRFSWIKIFVPLTNWCFFKRTLFNCFLWSSAFLQYFLLINLIMVFLEPLLDLPFLWQSSTSLDSTLTWISERIDVTVDSRSEPWTVSGMPEINKLFLLPYYYSPTVGICHEVFYFILVVF